VTFLPHRHLSERATLSDDSQDFEGFTFPLGRILLGALVMQNDDMVLPPGRGSG
jgi:hypothetical protein